MFIPSLIINQMYTYGSLKNTPEGVVFSIKNRLNDATLAAIHTIEIDREKMELGEVNIEINGVETLKATEITTSGRILTAPSLG